MDFWPQVCAGVYLGCLQSGDSASGQRQWGAGIPCAALLIIPTFVGEETGSEGGDLAGVRRGGPSRESLSCPCSLLCTLPGVGAWHCLHGSEVPGPHCGAGSCRVQALGILSHLPCSACPALSPSPHVGCAQVPSAGRAGSQTVCARWRWGSVSWGSWLWVSNCRDQVSWRSQWTQDSSRPGSPCLQKQGALGTACGAAQAWARRMGGRVHKALQRGCYFGSTEL